jgi:class 3 adenylate cyclase
MRAALTAHDEVLRSAIETHAGFMFKHTGDGVCGILVTKGSGGSLHRRATQTGC